MKYLGIDLGTANTYIYGVNDSSHLPKPIILPALGDATGSMATAVLYENNQPILAGNPAEAEYYTQADLQKKRRLASQFKPEISLANASALQATSDFLRICLQSLPSALAQDLAAVTVGIPSLAREDFRINLEGCFETAGWPKPVFARESDAALVSCLQAGAISVDDINRKCLILDFGGGTCDYTTVESLDILQNGGDTLFGGRLFDDLFYQAFCRADRAFANECPKSPYAWFAHWVECRRQKEKFSDFIDKHKEKNPELSLRINWHDAKGARREAFLHDYSRNQFLSDAENYKASPELLNLLAPYQGRGGLSQYARDLLDGRNIGLISWLRAILESVEKRREVSRVILTGGSSRWFFTQELAKEIFSAAQCIASSRGYEDIAFGLALFPLLTASRERAAVLLNEKLETFTEKALAKASALVAKQAKRIAALCSKRIVERDVMPALEAAQKKTMTAKELEEQFETNISSDKGLLEIAETASSELRHEIQEDLNFAFRAWLKENGVPLAPTFEFPSHAIGKDFFASISVKISRLDSLNLMAFTLQHVLPLLAGAATATIIAHSAEPGSTIIGGGAAFGLTWLMAKATPGFLEKRKLPAFILNEANRKKIAEKNREHIEEVLLKSMADVQAQLTQDIERRLKDSLKSMLASLSALNQVQIR